MRNTLVKHIKKKATKDTYFLTADLGFGVLEPLQKKLQNRFINVGIAEQAMIGVASGLALSGKEVYTFTIAAFYLRCLEQIKLDLCYQNAPVTMIGTGHDEEYTELGTSHYSNEVPAILEQLSNIEVHQVYTKRGLDALLSIPADKPRYIQISRFGEVEGTNKHIVDTNEYLKFLPKDDDNGEHTAT